MTKKQESELETLLIRQLAEAGLYADNIKRAAVKAAIKAIIAAWMATIQILKEAGYEK